MQTILVPVDFSPITDLVLAKTGQFAQRFAARVRLLHVAPPEPDFVGYEPGPQTVRDQVATKLHQEHRLLQAKADQLRRQGIEVTPLLVQGPTVDTILEEAKKGQVDLIILGSHGHGALYRALVGGVCEGLLRKTTCPILIVPARSAQTSATV